MVIGWNRVALAAAVMATFAGCGGGSEAPPSAAARSTTTTTVQTTTTLSFRTELGAPPTPDAIVVSMKDYKFLPATLRTSSPSLRVALSNDESVCTTSTCREADSVHDFVIVDGATGLPLARSERLHPGDAGLFVVDRLPAGTYRFFCALHVPASMEGTLEVVA